MAALFPRLLRRSSALRIAAGLNERPPCVLPPILSSYRQPGPSDEKANTPYSFIDGERANLPFSQYPSNAYPSFPLGCILDPIPLSGFEPVEVEDAEDVRTVWADSVKKKRKRKMNKHKYRKLRKLLRRKT